MTLALTFVHLIKKTLLQTNPWDLQSGIETNSLLYGALLLTVPLLLIMLVVFMTSILCVFRRNWSVYLKVPYLVGVIMFILSLYCRNILGRVFKDKASNIYRNNIWYECFHTFSDRFKIWKGIWCVYDNRSTGFLKRICFRNTADYTPIDLIPSIHERAIHNKWSVKYNIFSIKQKVMDMFRYS